MADANEWAGFEQVDAAVPVENEWAGFIQPPDLEDLTRPRPGEPRGVLDATWNAILAGVQGSGTVLAGRGAYASAVGDPLTSALPTRHLPENPSLWEEGLAGAAGIVADLPLIAAGAVGGGLAAAPTVIGGPAGMVAGGFVVPGATRGYLMAAYKSGGIKSFGDFWEAVKGFSHGAAEGAVTAAGLTVAGKTAAAVTTGAVKLAAVPLAELTGMTVAATAMQGRMPTLRDFEINAILVGGARAIPVVSRTLMDVYEKTGVPPAEVALTALKDPQLRRELLDAERVGPPTRYEQLALKENTRMAVPEMTPEQIARAKELYNDPFRQWSQAEGEPAVRGRVNMNRMNAPEEVKGIVEAVAQILDKEAGTEAGKPNAVPWEVQRTQATEQLAKILGTTVDKLPPTNLIDPRAITAEVRARRALMESAAADAVAKSKELRDLGDQATDLQRLEVYRAQDRLVMAYNEFIGIRGEAARATQAGADIHASNLSPQQISALVQKLGTAQDQAGRNRAFAEAENPVAALRAAKRITRTPFRTAMEIWKASILSGLTTFQANAIGGAAMFLAPIERAAMVASGKGFEAYYKAKALAAGKEYVPETRARWVEVEASFSGMMKTAADGLKLAGAVIQSAQKERVELLNREARRLATIRMIEAGENISSPDFNGRAAYLVEHPDAAMIKGLEAFAAKQQRSLDKVEHMPPAEPGTALSYAQIPFRVLSATDAIFRTMAEGGEAHALASRDAVMEGFKPGTKEFVDRVNQIELDPTPARMKEIEAAGDFYTYTTKLGKSGQAVQTILNEHPSLGFIVPFFKVPVNLAKFSAGYMPGVNLLMPSVRAALAEGGVARDRVVARMMIGTSITVAVAAGVANGIVTGGGYGLDKEGKASRIAAGTWQPYSIKIDGKWYSYARIQPMAAVISMVADASELSEKFVEGKRDVGMMGALIAAVGNATISQTYLLGLSNFVGAITDPNRRAERWFDQYAASLVPAGGFIGQIAAGVDPHAREINSVVDAVQARIPIWREELLPVRNPLTGQPTLPDRAWPLAPIKVTTPSEDKVLLWAAKLDVRVTNPPRSVHIGKGSGKIGKVDIEAENRNDYLRVQGEFAHEALSRIVHGPGWEKIPDIRKRDIYARVLQRARQKATLVAMPPEVRREEARRISQEVRLEYAKTPGVLEGFIPDGIDQTAE